VISLLRRIFATRESTRVALQGPAGLASETLLRRWKSDAGLSKTLAARPRAKGSL